MVCYFKKGKTHNWNAKQKFVPCREKVCDWPNMSKVAHEISCWRFLIDDAPWSDRALEVETNQIETLTETHQKYSMWEIVDILKISKSSAENHLHLFDYVNHFDVWIPHKQKILLDLISTCDSLPKHNKNIPFLKQILMGDEKWIPYNNVE